MSWLARSIANSLKLEDDDDDNDQYNNNTPNPNVTDSKSPSNPQSDHQTQSPSPSSPSSTTSATTPRGVKEDLSELTKTLTRQFWGVASFLAPSPDPPSSSSSSHSSQISNELSDNPQPHLPSDPEASNEDLIAGIRSDFAEIGGKFKSGISKLSTNAAVSEITKMASNFLQLGSENDLTDEDLIGSAVGVTEEVVAFARDISMHPETWLDFPVTDDEEFDDFDMSDAQQEHALTVERLAPRLAALRIELCPGYMSEGCFWKIYFVLLHPRLSKHDAELLSTPQILEARTILSHQLQKHSKPSKPGWSEIGTSRSNEIADLPHEESLSVPSPVPVSESVPPKTSSIEVVSPTVAAKTSIKETVSSSIVDELETEKHPVQSTEMQIIDKAVVEEEPFYHAKAQHLSSSIPIVVDEKFEDDTDDWLREDSSEMVGTSATSVPIENDEDVSFSDLEEDDEDVPISYKKVTSSADASTKDSRDWVQLSKSSADSVKDINPVSVKHAVPEQVSARNSEPKESNDWLDVDDIDVM
ncbi:hypothetical protein JCGZ_12561 [Jatropha curcas]|uniref:BSD domain-containing protein n=1 Tax=Jatropha curcas TaxID=180498 RepID=A0A067KIK7_JATCU|nr:uncharacterized protein LOC105639870 [Jatropha curcas]KDP32100.1 hypothetical protein JCGZ_12561 [Jatropha curcas]